MSPGGAPADDDIGVVGHGFLDIDSEIGKGPDELGRSCRNSSGERTSPLSVCDTPSGLANSSIKSDRRLFQITSNQRRAVASFA